MKTCWGNVRIAPHILYLGTIWRWVVRFKSHPLYPGGGGKPSRSHSIGGWVGPRAGLHTVGGFHIVIPSSNIPTFVEKLRKTTENQPSAQNSTPNLGTQGVLTSEPRSSVYLWWTMWHRHTVLLNFSSPLLIIISPPFQRTVMLPPSGWGNDTGKGECI
jgi:hypothetical protein